MATALCSHGSRLANRGEFGARSHATVGLGNQGISTPVNAFHTASSKNGRMTQSNIIDVWMQHPTLRHLQHEMFVPLRRWVGADIPSEELPLQTTIRAMDEGGVVIGLVSAWYGPAGDLISNDEVAAFVAEYPERLRGLAGVDLRKPMDAVRDLRRRVESGFVGLRIIPWLWELPPTNKYYFPLYTACADLGIPFCTQVGHTGPLRPSETGRPIPYIDEIAIDFPELKIVCGHIGYPWTTEMIAVADKHENVYIDTSAYSTNRYPAELVEYMKGRGRKKVLFGSNYPMMTPARALAKLDSLELDEETTDLFLRGNARRIFNL